MHSSSVYYPLLTYRTCCKYWYYSRGPKGLCPPPSMTRIRLLIATSVIVWGSLLSHQYLARTDHIGLFGQQASRFG